jgi:hypothetical protein
MTAEMRPWYPASTGAHTAGRRRRIGGPRRAPSRYGVARGTRAPGGFQRPRDAAYGEERAAAGGQPWAARGGALDQIVLKVPCLKLNISKILYKSAPNVEYESCRSQTHLQLSQRLYGVFLNRFCSASLSTLYATQLQ